MKVVYVVDTFAIWGGLERVLADKMNYLTGHAGYEVFLMTVNQGNHLLTYELHPEIKHIDLGVRMHQQYQYRGIKRLLIRNKLYRILRKRVSEELETIRPDIIICVKLDFVGVLLELKGDTPLVVESHTLCQLEKVDEVGWFRKLYVWFLKRSIHMVNAVVTLTEGDTQDWKCINNNICKIPNVVHLNDSETFSTYEQKNVIYVGRFSHQKDIDSLLKIWKIIYYQYPDWRLDIYGEGELKDYYQAKIQSLNANIHVFEPTGNIMKRYFDHSILLLTSSYEPFGLVLPEAMSCGLPVVAFDCPYGPAEIITDGVDGFLIKNRDIQAFADRVCQLIEDEELRRWMGQNGIVSSQRYRADIIMPKWINLFEKLTFGQ